MSGMNRFMKMHAVKLLIDFFPPKKGDIPKVPLDRFVRSYFKNNKSIGSNERRMITEKVYDVIRYQTLLGYLSKQKGSFEESV